MRNNGHKLGAASVACTGVLLSFVLGSGCATNRAHSKVPQVLNQQADAWNRGDVESFMTAYWRSPELTFASGGEVTRGFAATLERYHKRYPTPEAMGKLTFSDLEVRPLGAAHALVLGRWHLDREKPIGGVFTLVMELRDGAWVIIHDHTSKAE